MEKQYLVVVDKEKNRLYIDLYNIDTEQSDQIIDEIFAKAQQLKAGWGCIVNYTKVDILLSKEILEKAETAMSFLKQLGMGQLARVFTEEQSSYADELKQRSMKVGRYEGIGVRTVQDADAIFDIFRIKA